MIYIHGEHKKYPSVTFVDIIVWNFTVKQ